MVVIAGGIVTGNPLVARLPGPYHVAAEQRSIEPEGIAAANWALVELGPDNRIVADRTNAKLMGGLGLQYPVTSANQHIGTAWPMYALTLDQNNLDVLRRRRHPVRRRRPPPGPRRAGVSVRVRAVRTGFRRAHRADAARGAPEMGLACRRDPDLRQRRHHRV